MDKFPQTEHQQASFEGISGMSGHPEAAGMYAADGRFDIYAPGALEYAKGVFADVKGRFDKAVEIQLANPDGTLTPDGVAAFNPYEPGVQGLFVTVARIKANRQRQGEV